jgi:hypothetical protein
MIKNSVFLTILILAFPLTAFANGVDFTNSSGTLSGTDSGMTLAGSTLIAVNGLGSGLITGTDLGTLKNISSGDTNIVTTVPEPGTLGLLGTGLIGVAGIVGRKLKSV